MSSMSTQILFIDSRIASIESLLAQVDPSYQVVLLNSEEAGLTQIANALQGRTGIEALHVLSHGGPGFVLLGSNSVNADVLAQQSAAAQSIGAALSATADILIYGCDVAANEAGRAFVDLLAQLTGADVAASTNVTGAAFLGGDWTLEAQSGAVETEAISAPEYAQTLAINLPASESYTEQQGNKLLTGIDFTSGSNFGTGYIRFEVTGGNQTTDFLALTNAANPNADGAISVSGNVVYRGLGSSTMRVGTIDSTHNGQNGRALQVNFENATLPGTSPVINGDFSQALSTGWEAYTGQVDMGVTFLGGWRTPADTGRADSFSTGGTYGSYDSPIVQISNGRLRLEESRMTTASYGVVHGPAAVSATFAASAGMVLKFDWEANYINDDYDVVGYLLNVGTGATLVALDSTGTRGSGTATVAVTDAGNYKFIFVSGTFDRSGGRLAGASMFIDNIRVEAPALPQSVLESLSALVTYRNTSDNPTTNKTLTVSSRDIAGVVQSNTMAINVTAVNDPSSLAGGVLLNTIVEDVASGSNAGQTISSLFTALFSDVDTGNTLGGVVVVGNTASSEGTWEYSTGGNTWHAVGSVSPAQGLVLSESTLVRFVPAANWNGTPPSLTVYGVDQTRGGVAATSGATRSVLDTTTAPASSGLSGTTQTMGISVTAVNDAPTFTSTLPTPTLLDSSAWDSTAAGVNPNNATLTGTLTGNDIESQVADLTFTIRGGTTSGNTVTMVGRYGTLTLNTTNNGWTYTPDDWTAINALAAGVTANDTFDFKITDPQGAYSLQTLTVAITGTNDLPRISSAIANQSFSGPGTWTFQVPANAFTDAEGTGLTYAAQLNGGGTLPTWLTFNAATRTFSGNPPAGVGSLSIDVTATDTNGASVTDNYVLTLTSNDDAPTGGVTISNTTPVQNQALTAANTLADLDIINNNGITYQWYADGVAIGGATGATFTPGQNQVGKSLTVVATYTDRGNIVNHISSAPTTPVSNVFDMPTGVTTLEDTSYTIRFDDLSSQVADLAGATHVRVMDPANGVLRLNNTPLTYDGSGYAVVTVAQLKNGVLTYLPDANYRGSDSISVGLSTNNGSTYGSQYALPVTVTPVNDAPTGSVTISHNSGVLTASHNLADADGPSPLTGLQYQWYVNGQPVGTNSSTYTLQAGDQNKSVTVRISYTDADSNAGAVTSAPYDNFALVSGNTAPILSTPSAITLTETALIGGAQNLSFTALTVADGSQTRISVTDADAADASLFSFTLGSIQVSNLDVSSATNGATLATLIANHINDPQGINDQNVSVSFNAGVLTITDTSGRATSGVSLLKPAASTAIDNTPTQETSAAYSISNGELADISEFRITFNINGQPISVNRATANPTSSSDPNVIAANIQAALRTALGDNDVTVTWTTNKLTVVDAAGRYIYPYQSNPWPPTNPDIIKQNGFSGVNGNVIVAGSIKFDATSQDIVDADGFSITVGSTTVTPNVLSDTDATIAATIQTAIRTALGDTAVTVTYASNVLTISDAQGRTISAPSFTKLVVPSASTAVNIGGGDNAGFNGGSVYVSLQNGGAATETLSLSTTVTDNVHVNAGNVVVGGVTIGTVSPANNGTSGNAFEVLLNSSATSAKIQDLIQALKYQNTSDTPGASRVVDVKLTDAGGLSDTESLTVNITAVNSPPTSTDVVVPVARGVNYVLGLQDFGIYTDPENGPQGYVIITSVASLVAAGATLKYQTTPITSSSLTFTSANNQYSTGPTTTLPNSATGYWVTVADVLNGRLSIDVPANAPRQFTGLQFYVQENPTSLTPNTLTLTTTTNAAPAGSATATLADGTEDTSYTVSAVTVAGADLLDGFSDADGDALAVSGLTADRGTVINNGDGTYTITPEANYVGPVVLSYSVIDGQGGVVAATRSFNLTAVNDPIVLTTPVANYNVTAGSNISLVLTKPFTDPDGPNGTLSTGAATLAGITYAATVVNGPLGSTLADYGLSMTVDNTNHTLTIAGNPVGGVAFLDIELTGTETNGGSTLTTSFKINLNDASASGSSNIQAFSANQPGSVSVTGTPTQGNNTLTAAVTDADGFNAGSLNYQWQVSSDSTNGVDGTWTDINGATLSTLSLASSALGGKWVRPQAFYLDNGGFTEAPIGTGQFITNTNDPAVVSIANFATPGTTLFATVTDDDGMVGVTPTYTWQTSANGTTNWTTVGGNFSSYTPVAGDGGRFIRVSVSYTDQSGFANTGTSNVPQVQVGQLPPVANNDTNTSSEASGLDNATAGSNISNAASVLANDTDTNGMTGAYISSLRTGDDEGFGTDAGAAVSSVFTLQGLYGTLTMNTNGTYSYVIDQNNADVQALTPTSAVMRERFNYTVTDATGRANDDTSSTSTNSIGVLEITISGANDQPTMTGQVATTNVNEDVATALPLSTLVFVDPDSTSLYLRLVVSSGTLRAESLDGVTVTGSDTNTLTLSTADAAAFSGWLAQNEVLFRSAANDNATSPTLTYSVSDDGVTYNTMGTTVIDVLPVNDALIVDAGGDVLTSGTVGVSEVVKIGFLPSASAAQIRFDGATVAVAAGATSQQIAAAFAAQDANMPNWTVANNGDGTVTLTAAATGAVANLNDASFTDANNAISALVLTPAGQDNVVTFKPRGTSVFIAPNLTLTDIESDTVASATVSIASGVRDNQFGTTYETLSLSSAAQAAAATAGITIATTPSANGFVMTMTGTATLAQYQAALRAIKYENSNPNAFAGDRTVTINVNDGTQNSNLQTFATTAANTSIAVGQRIFIDGADSGAIVSEVLDSMHFVASKPLTTLAAGSVLDFYNAANQPGGAAVTTATAQGPLVSTVTVLVPWTPAVDNNGILAGVDLTRTYYERSAPVAIATADASMTDQDGLIRNLTITLTNPQDNGGATVYEYLTAPSEATLKWLSVRGITLVGNGTGGVTTLTDNNNNNFTVTNVTGATQFVFTASGAGTDATNFQVALRGVGYQNMDHDPTTNVARIVNVTSTDVAGNVGVDATTTINVGAVNDAPAGTDATFTIDEDTPRTFTAADFGFSDALDGTGANALQAVKITTLPANGTLTLSGVALQAGATIAVADLGNLSFTPLLNANGNAADSFTFQVQDNGGTDNGGVDLDPSANTITYNITAINDAPVLGGSSALPAIAEDISFQVNTGTTVGSMVANGSITDVDVVGAAPEAIAVTAVNNTNGTWQYKVGAGNWQAFNFTGANAGSALLLSSTDSIRFVPNADWNGEITNGVTFRAWDQTTGSAGNYLPVSGNTGGTATLSAESQSIGPFQVTSVNDNPFVSGSQTATGNEDSTISLSGFTVGDADVGDVLTLEVSLADATKGSLNFTSTSNVTGTFSGTTLSLTGSAANVQTALNSLKYTPVTDLNSGVPANTPVVLNLRVQDNANSGWQPYTVNVPGKFFYSFNGHYYEFVSASGISWQDAFDAAQTRTLYGLKGYLATVTSAAENEFIRPKLGGQGWIGASDGRSAVNGTNSVWTIWSDGVVTAGDGTVNGQTSRNTVPAGVTASSTFTTSEGKWTWVSGPEAGTQFWQDQSTETGGSESFQGSTVNGMYANWSGGEPNNHGGNEDYAHFLTSGAWNDYPLTSGGITGYVVEYGGLAGDAPSVTAATLDVTVTPVNDRPVLSPASATLTVIDENAITNNGQTVASFMGAVTDVDTGTNSAGNGTGTGIAVTAVSSGGIGGSWQFSTDNGTSWTTITLTSGQALPLLSTDRVRYLPDQVGGTTANNLTQPSLTYSAWDTAVGTRGTVTTVATLGGNAASSSLSSATDTVTITVTDLNDAPVITVPAPVTLLEDATAAITGVSIADVDITGRADADGTNNNITVSLSVANGSITLAGTTGVVISAGANASGSMTLTGTLADINTAIATLTYAPNADFAGQDALVIDANDLGNVGGAALSATQQTIAITVTGVNDAPVLTDGTPTLTTIDENNVNSTGTLISDLVGSSAPKTIISDVDGNTADGTEAIGQGVAIYGLSTANGQGGGTWQYKLGNGNWTNAGAVDAQNALLLGANDSIRFVPDAQNSTTGTVSYRLWDGASGTAGQKVDVSTNGGTTAFSIGTDSASITVTDVNDAPTVTVNGGFSSVYFGAMGPAVNVFAAGSVTLGDVDIGDRVTGATVSIDALYDLDNDFGTIYESLLTTAAGGVVTVGSNTITITGNGTGAGNRTNATVLTLTGNASLADYQTALATIQYINNNPNAYAGPRPIRLQITDDGDPDWSATDTPSNIGTVTVNVNWGPVVDMSSAINADRDLYVSYAEGDPAVLISASNAEIKDLDGNIASVTVTLTNPLDGSSESIFISDASALVNAGVTATVSPSGHAIVLTPTSAAGLDGTKFQLALRTIKYQNLSESPTANQRDIAVTSLDVDSNPGLIAHTYINVSGTNDAPVLTANGVDFTTITEDATTDVTNAGQLVSSILGTVTDVDNTAQPHSATNGKLTGVAIHTLSSGGVGGSWQYKLASDQTNTWVNITSITANKALLLGSADSIRFVPDTYGGTTANNLAKPSISYYAWDQATGTAGTELTIAGNQGGSGTLSNAGDTVEITVTDVNDAPVITAPATATVAEDGTVGITGVSIADVDVTNRTDSTTANDNVQVTLSVTSGTITLASVTGLTFNNSTINGSATIDVTGSLSAVNAAVATLTYAPVANFNGSDALVVNVNDLGNVGGTALSATQQTIAITVTGVNDAPVLTDGTPALTTINENATDNTGTLVSALVGAGGNSTGISDVDGNTAEGTEAIGQGIAVYGLSYNYNGGAVAGGTWQYMLANGSWTDVGTVNVNNALLLQSTSSLRFVPDAQNGGSGTVSFYLWDGATGTAGAKVDVTLANRGGITAFSIDPDQATITVSDVFDNTVVTAEDLAGAVTEAGTAQSNALTDTGTLTFTDVDWSGVHSLSSSASVTTAAATPVGTTLGSLALVLNSDTNAGGTGQLTWTYSVADNLVEYLKAGELKIERFTVNIYDNQGATITRTVEVTITGTNDAPVIAATTATGGVTELVTPAGNLTAGATIGFTDVDLADTHTITSTSAITGQGTVHGAVTASVTTDTTGTGTGGVITWNYSVNASSVEYLAVGETKVEQFDIVLDDNNDGLDLQARRVAVTITGTNDAPTNITTTTNPSLSINEVVGQTSFLSQDTTVATFASTDVDLTDTHVYSIVGGADAQFFQIVNGNQLQLRQLTPLDAEVKRTFVVDIQTADRQGGVAAGGTFTKTFTITVNDIDEFDVVARNWLVQPQTFTVNGTPTAFAANTLPEYNYTGTGTQQSPGTFIGVTAVAEDQDATNNTITYALVSDATGANAYVGRNGNANDAEFRIDSTTGALYAIGNLDYETEGGLRTLFVKATSSDGSSVVSSITLNIANVDEVAPTFNNGATATATTLVENSGAGQVVYTAQATDTDFNAPNTATSIVYSLDAVGDHQDFQINQTTGAVTLIANPDFETKSAYTFTVRARDADGNFTTQVVTLGVSNLNDNPVTAVSDSNGTANTVAENASVGALVGLTASASDADVGAVVTYSLSDSANGKFAIDAASGVVTVAGPLDHEAATSHSITVVASSSDGSPSQSQSFTIAVSNVNDNLVTSVTDSNAAANSVAESAAVGTAVGITALASDADVGAVVTYTLSDNAGGKFAIDANTGVVTVAGALDHETDTSHNITVVASSNDGSAPTSQTYTIEVTNVNDNLVTAVSDTNGAADTVLENAAIGATVGITAQASDADRGAAVTYSLSNNAGGRFAIDPTSGVVTVAGALDHETATSHTITVVASSSDGSASTSQNYTIAVGNVNDNPVTTLLDTNAAANTLAENAAIGAAVGITVQASDADAGGQAITYVMTNAAGGRFAVDPNTGVVTLAAALDFESATSHNIEIQATSADGSTNIASYTVAVTNVNDNAVSPVSDADAAADTVLESAAVGATVGITAQASDADSGSVVTYSLSDNAGGRFAINPTTGVVTVASALDYETATSHTITVVASSSDGSPSTSQNYTIAVGNVNDNPVTPVTDSNAANNSVAENAAVGAAVGITAQASDADAGAVVTYTLSDNAGGKFAINQSTGVVTVAAALDHEAATSHNITVVASSSDGSPSTSQSYTIAVTNVNDNPVVGPTDTNNATNNVNENVAVGTVVSGLTLAASDADRGTTIAYSLTNNAGGRFAIDATTGVVTVAGPINFEAASSHVITVQALSSDGSVNTANLTINVNNQNDAPTGTPYIAGTALQGSTLTIERNDLADEDGINTNTFSYKWYADGVEIANENSAAITLKQDQVGKSITASISYLDNSGYTNTTAQTAAVGGVLDLNDAPLAVASNVAATEDSALILPASSFGFSDAIDAGGLGTADTLLSVRIESLPATGTGVLTLNGAAVTVGQVIAASALVNTSAGLVFTPATNVNGPVSFTFSVQDNGGTANAGRDWSLSAATMTLNIAAVNDAPVLTVTAPAMAAVSEDAALPLGAVGTLVSSLVGGISDVDASALRGVAITDANTSNGSYFYSLNNGTNWTAFPALSASTALLLAADSNTRVYFKPNANFNGSVSDALTFRAWDQTSGTAGTTANTAVGTAFSSTTDRVSVAVMAVNDVPTLVTALVNQAATEDQSFSYTLAAGSFADVEDANLNLSATLANGAQLPAWLVFNPGTRTFSGTPGNADVTSLGSPLQVRVTATDSGNQSVSSTFNLSVANVNDGPTLANALLDRTVAQGGTLSYQFAANSFADIDAGDTLTYTATKANGDPLPTWLSFNAATRTFSGTPANGDVGSVDVKVTAKDDSNAQVSDTFTVTVTNVNDAPTVANALVAQSATQGMAYSYDISGAFADVDVGDALTYSATLSNGAALPGWLTFNAATRTFSGTPGNSDVGTVAVRVTATDTGNQSASSTFNLVVADINDAPTGAVTVNGTVKQGVTLSAVTSAIGDPDGGVQAITGYQWFAGNTEIAGATGSSFTPTQAQVGQTIKVKVSYTDGRGFPNEIHSAPTAAVVNDLAVISKLPEFERVAAVLGLTGATPDGTAIYGISARDVQNANLGFSLSGTVNVSGKTINDYLRLVEDDANNKATVYLRSGVTLQSLVNALGGLAANPQFSVLVQDGSDVLTDVVTLGGPGSDINTTSNTADPNLVSPSSTDINDGNIVYQATAEDPSGAGLFTFSLSGPDAGYFLMNPSTGAVTVNPTAYNDPAFLLRDTYNVNVVVADGVLGQTRTSSTSIVLDRPEVDQNAGVTVVATTKLVNGNTTTTTNNDNAEVTITQIPVAPSQLPSGVSVPMGLTELVATQEVDKGAVPTSFSMFVSPSANVNGFWTAVNGALVNLASPEMGGSLNPTTGQIDLDLARASQVLNYSFVDNGVLTLEGAPAHVDIGALGANPMQVSSLFWS